MTVLKLEDYVSAMSDRPEVEHVTKKLRAIIEIAKSEQDLDVGAAIAADLAAHPLRAQTAIVILAMLYADMEKENG